MAELDDVPNIDLGADTVTLRKLVGVWRDRYEMNVRRSRYHDGEQGLKDFGISIPPQVRQVRAALGWTAKGLNAFTNRSQFEAFTVSSGVDDPFGLSEVIEQNNFVTEFEAARVSSAMHGCSFLTVTRGDVGEPAAVVLARSAEDSAALWDRRTRRLSAFLSVVDSVDGRPVEFVMYTPEYVYEIVKKSGVWSHTRKPHMMGEVPAYPLVHGYELRRPLGHSRISRAAMYFVDAALRTIVRSEVSSEFYSAVEYWLFGADVTQFVGDNPWTARMGTVKAMDIDNPEQKPELHRFTGASPQPHIEQMRMWANLFADEMDLEVKFADTSNPSSAEAIFAAKETQIVSVRSANRLWGRGATLAMRAAARILGASDGDELLSLRAQFTDPAIVSPSARADAFSKLASDIDGFGSTQVGLEVAGLSRDQIQRYQAEKKRGEATSRISQLVDAARGMRDGDSGADRGLSGGDGATDAVGSVGTA